MIASAYRPFITLLFMLCCCLWISCSSEEPEPPNPCANVTCENGSCNNGKCACEEGWVGPFCTNVDFSGEWRMTQYTTINCPRFFETDIKGDGSQRQLCGKAEGFDVCYETFMDLKTDGSYDRTDALFLHNEDGTVETIFDIEETGTWEAEMNDSRIRTRTDGETGFRLFLVEDNKTTMGRVHDQVDGGPTCSLVLEFRKA